MAAVIMTNTMPDVSFECKIQCISSDPLPTSTNTLEPTKTKGAKGQAAGKNKNTKQTANEKKETVKTGSKNRSKQSKPRTKM